MCHWWILFCAPSPGPELPNCPWISRGCQRIVPSISLTPVRSRGWIVMIGPAKSRPYLSSRPHSAVSGPNLAYIILPGLIPKSLLDTAWQAYEQVVRRGKIKLPPESVGDGDQFPGRFLNPHKRVGQFCRVAKHPELMHWLQRLLGHPAKLLQTIASH